MHLATKGIPILMKPEYPSPKIVLCANANSYIASYQGGAIYELSDTKFIYYTQKNIEQYEKV